MHLTDILTAKRIKAPLASSTKDALIAELVDVLADDGVLGNRQKVLEAVMEREHTRTTGIGNGLAIPHGKCSEVKELVMAIGKPAAGVDFESIDSKPVTLVFLLVGPTDMTGPHIQALAHISRMLSIDAFRAKLNQATSAQEIFDAIEAQEKTVG